jgi:prophage DNA circulation protein
MLRADAKEAAPLVQRLCANLSAIIPDKGPPGSAARTAIGDVVANVEVWLQSDIIGQPLNNCFDLVRQTGSTLGQFDWVRAKTAAEAPVTLGATLIRDCSIQMCLAQEAQIIADMTFVSRSDVEDVIATVQQPFADSEEIAADTMDPMVYRGLVSLHAAVINHLVVTARPLPEMLQYKFAQALPSLIISQRLYGDASRYDQIRQENRIVHPLFCPALGRALSF